MNWLDLPSQFPVLLQDLGRLGILGISLLVFLVVAERFGKELVGEFMIRALPQLFVCIIGYILFGLLGIVFHIGIRGRGFASMPEEPIRAWAIVGLVLTALLSTWLIGLSARRDATSDRGKRRGAWFFRGLWIGFCIAGLIGHWAGSMAGLFLLTIPAIVLFWIVLYQLSRFILPLDEDQDVSEAFRCLLTFSAGTNYPYYAMEGREKVKRVEGNQFARPELIEPDIWGPGIFLTGPDHVVAVSDGLKFKGVRGPGVVFSYVFEDDQDPMDLRPQQRAYTVEARTKDGIQMEFTTFGPFQLDAGDQRPEPGKAFPFRATSVYKAFHAQPIDVERSKIAGEVSEERKRRCWDEMYEMKGKHIMQDIIAEYDFDQLCEPLDENKNPRDEIGKKYKIQMGEVLAEYGIAVPGGGISNLYPAERDELIKRRVMAWQAEQQRRIMEQLGEYEAKVEEIIGKAQAEVQSQMIEHIGGVVKDVRTGNRDLIFNTMALQFIESLREMAEKPEMQERLPEDTTKTVRRMMRIIGQE